jgi:hypothetical protein
LRGDQDEFGQVFHVFVSFCFGLDWFSRSSVDFLLRQAKGTSSRLYTGS